MLLQDMRFGVRTAARNKGATGISILCLAIGIGLNTSMFSVVDGVLIQPLPYRTPDRLVELHATQQSTGIRHGSLSFLDVRDWQERARSYDAIGAMQGRSFTLTDGGEPQRYSGAAISQGLFPLLGVAAQVGRTLTSDDDRRGAEPVVLISDDLWHRRFGANPSIVGIPVNVNGRPHTVIGVMPPHFNFPDRQQLWLPLAEYADFTDRGDRALAVFARLRDGVTLEQARREGDAIAASLAAAHPDTNGGWGSYIRPLRDAFLPQDVRTIIIAMMGSVTLVLLIACFNVANLTLARASTRAREIAIRTALGAGRAVVVRQLLTESVLVGLASVPLGALLGWAFMQVMNASIPPDTLPYFIHWALNVRSLIYAVLVAIAAGLVFGLTPAVHASRTDLQEALKEGGRGTAGGSRARIRNILVVAEVALALVLLVGASLFVRSFLNLQGADGGFDTAPLMTLRFYMPNEQYPGDDTKTRRVDDIVRRVESLPGVQAAFASNMIPLGSGGGDAQIVVDGLAIEKGKEPDVGFTGVTPHMLRTLGLQPARGRFFTDAEGASRTPVAVINEAMARKFWPKADPLGGRFRRVGESSDEWFTVIGVAPDFRQNELDTNEPIWPCAFVPYLYGATTNTGLTMRTAGDPALLAGPAREQIRASDPSIAVFASMTMQRLRERGYWQYFLFGWMFATYGLIALLLAAVGVYGVLSYAVSQRTPEIGVRVALGATRGDVLALIVGEGLRLALLGVGLGIAGSFFVTRFVRAQLYNVSPTDPLSFALVSLFLSLVAFLASYLPARRATAVDPLVALRVE